MTFIQKIKDIFGLSNGRPEWINCNSCKYNDGTYYNKQCNKCHGFSNWEWDGKK